jgi:cytochrome c oxidase subunit III
VTDELREPYPTLDRQHEAGRFGMMIFLASELMLFGALFAAAFVLFMRHPKEFADASGRLDLWLGTANTAVLLTSSLLVAVGGEARAHRPRRTAATFLAGAALGLAFLGIKATEYAREYAEGLMPNTDRAHFDSGAHRLFMDFYFTATGLHALHVSVGIVLLAILAVRQRSDRPASAMAIDNAGLYWHLVDVIWIFLFPVLYLMRG